MFEYQNNQLIPCETLENNERNIVSFELSDIDNRVVKFKKYELSTSWMVEYILTFSSVYHRHFFAELFFHGTKQQQADTKGKDLRILVITWNLGQKDIKGFKDIGKMIPKVDDYDLVAFGTQECPRKYKVERAKEIENFMLPKGFVNIDGDNQMATMFEMFCIVFVKQDLATEVSSVAQTQIAKGLWNFVGNKGCIAYSFKLKNRQFTFISTHLRHGQNAVRDRNEMAS